MSKKVNIDEIAQEINKVLDEYRDASVEVIENGVKEVTKEAVKELKSGSPKRSGKYGKDWTSRTERQTNKWAFKKTVYNAKHYRLTHLLEYGHQVKPRPVHKGKLSAVPAHPHIKKVADKAEESLVKYIKENI